jgi:DNA-directed RNA polymerase specialized sigma24 family protein
MSADPMGEDRLSTLIASGDREAIARALYPRARRMVASVLRTLDRDLIETATSETLLAVCKYHHTFRGRSRVTSWLYRIAFREAQRVLRSRYTLVSLDELAVGREVRGGVTPADAGAALEAWEEVLAAVPRRSWLEIWILANEPGRHRSAEAIAALTGYSARSVPVILSRIRTRLAKGAFSAALRCSSA